MNRPRRLPFRFGSAVLVGIVFFCCKVGNVYGEPFQNLGFEEAVIGPVYENTVSASQALPYWTNSYEAAGGSAIWYDATPNTSPCVSIHDGKPGDQVWGHPYSPLVGNYSVFLAEGAGPYGDIINSWIAQTGDVPADARSLMFKTDMPQGVNRLVVSLNGTAIPMQLYSTDGTVNPYWGPVETFIGDISAFTGQQNVDLQFTKIDQDPSDPYVFGGVDIDNIQFSPTVVPEPSTLALIVIGVLSAPLYFLLRPRALAK